MVIYITVFINTNLQWMENKKTRILIFYIKCIYNMYSKIFILHMLGCLYSKCGPYREW